MLIWGLVMLERSRVIVSGISFCSHLRHTGNAVSIVRYPTAFTTVGPFQSVQTQNKALWIPDLKSGMTKLRFLERLHAC